MIRFEPLRRRLAFAVFGACLSLVSVGCASADERTIHQSRSDFNGAIVVSETDDGLRVLRFEPGGARQSVVKPGDPDHLELAYAKVMPIALGVVDRVRSVLIIGLGGGTLPMFLRAHDAQLIIDVVDIDPAVIAVAKSHFGFREDAAMRAIAADGRRFVETTPRRYDLVILDAFGASEMPYVFVTTEFHAAVRRALAPGGAIVANVWSSFSNPLYTSMLKTYEAAYEATAIIDIEGSGNKLVIAKFAPLASRAELVRRAEALQKRLALRSDLARVIERGLRPFGADGASGRVLRDADRR